MVCLKMVDTCRYHSGKKKLSVMVSQNWDKCGKIWGNWWRNYSKQWFRWSQAFNQQRVHGADLPTDSCAAHLTISWTEASSLVKRLASGRSLASRLQGQCAYPLLIKHGQWQYLQFIDSVPIQMPFYRGSMVDSPSGLLESFIPSRFDLSIQVKEGLCLK